MAFASAASALNDKLFGYMARSGLVMFATARTSVESLTGAVYHFSATLPATYDASGYATAMTAAAIVGSVESVTPYGSKRPVTTFIPINGAAQKAKGTPDYGVITMMFGDVPTDAGQIVVKASEASPNHYSLSITYADGEVHYLDVLCSSFEYGGAKAGDVKTVTATLNICMAPVIVAPV
jgi:hypothetical protein